MAHASASGSAMIRDKEAGPPTVSRENAIPDNDYAQAGNNGDRHGKEGGIVHRGEKWSPATEIHSGSVAKFKDRFSKVENHEVVVAAAHPGAPRSGEIHAGGVAESKVRLGRAFEHHGDNDSQSNNAPEKRGKYRGEKWSPTTEIDANRIDSIKSMWGKKADSVRHNPAAVAASRRRIDASEMISNSTGNNHAKARRTLDGGQMIGKAGGDASEKKGVQHRGEKWSPATEIHSGSVARFKHQFSQPEHHKASHPRAHKAGEIRAGSVARFKEGLGKPLNKGLHDDASEKEHTSRGQSRSSAPEIASFKSTGGEKAEYPPRAAPPPIKNDAGKFVTAPNHEQSSASAEATSTTNVEKSQNVNADRVSDKLVAAVNATGDMKSKDGGCSPENVGAISRSSDKGSRKSGSRQSSKRSSRVSESRLKEDLGNPPINGLHDNACEKEDASREDKWPPAAEIASINSMRGEKAEYPPRAIPPHKEIDAGEVDNAPKSKQSYASAEVTSTNKESQNAHANHVSDEMGADVDASENVKSIDSGGSSEINAGAISTSSDKGSGRRGSEHSSKRSRKSGSKHSSKDSDKRKGRRSSKSSNRIQGDDGGGDTDFQLVATSPLIDPNENLSKNSINMLCDEGGGNAEDNAVPSNSLRGGNAKIPLVAPGKKDYRSLFEKILAEPDPVLPDGVNAGIRESHALMTPENRTPLAVSYDGQEKTEGTPRNSVKDNSFQPASVDVDSVPHAGGPPSVSHPDSKVAIEERLLMLVKEEIILLVSEVLPDQADNVDELLAQFEGREEKLRDTLRSMQQRASLAEEEEVEEEVEQEVDGGTHDGTPSSDTPVREYETTVVGGDDRESKVDGGAHDDTPTSDTPLRSMQQRASLAEEEVEEEVDKGTNDDTPTSDTPVREYETMTVAVGGDDRESNATSSIQSGPPSTQSRKSRSSFSFSRRPKPFGRKSKHSRSSTALPREETIDVNAKNKDTGEQRDISYKEKIKTQKELQVEKRKKSQDDDRQPELSTDEQIDSLRRLIDKPVILGKNSRRMKLKFGWTSTAKT